MKKNSIILTITFLVGMISLSFSQDNTTDTQKNNNEINVFFDDIFAKSILVIKTNTTTSTTPNLNNSMPKVGLGYKYNFNNSAFRSKISFGLMKTRTNEYSSYKLDYLSLTSKLDVGYELQKKLGKVQLFYGLDLFADYSKVKETPVDVDPEASIAPYSSSYTWGIGVSPFMGVKYFLIPSLAISTELHFSIESFKTKNESTGNYISNNTRKEEIKGLITHLGPLGNIGICLYF